MVAQGFSVLVLIKILCVQCEEIFALFVPKLQLGAHFSPNPASPSVKVCKVWVKTNTLKSQYLSTLLQAECL